MKPLKTTALAGAMLAAAPRLFAQTSPATPAASAAPAAAHPRPRGRSPCRRCPTPTTPSSPTSRRAHHADPPRQTPQSLRGQSQPGRRQPRTRPDTVDRGHLDPHGAGLQSNVRTAIRNNGGGHYNHSLFWQMMKPAGGGEPSGELATAINGSFGSFERLQERSLTPRP